LALNARGDRIHRDVPALAARLGIRLQACGLGSLFAFRFVDGPVLSIRDAAAEDPDLLQALFLFLLGEGVLIHPRHSFLSNAHGDAEVDTIVEGYGRSLREIQTAA
jgi:glutamate-1-semialdehyde aminotransferase